MLEGGKAAVESAMAVGWTVEGAIAGAAAEDGQTVAAAAEAVQIENQRMSMRIDLGLEFL